MSVRALLAHTNGNQTVAAQVAGLDRTDLGSLLAKLGNKGLGNSKRLAHHG